MNDDLEYYISFPLTENFENSCNPNDKEVCYYGNNTQDFYHNSKRLKVEPVIFLLGWLGAQDRHLAKYSSMYNQLGCITVRYTAPVEDLFFSSDKKLGPIAKKLLNLLKETSLSNHPIIFHSFSNNGSILYSHISKSLESNPDFGICVKGCIFDSTPAPRNLFTAMKAIYRAVDGPIWLRVVTSSAVCIYLCIWGAFKIMASLCHGQWPSLPPWSLIKEPFKWPQLFLYSETDDLIPYKYVEFFAKKRESLGVAVHKYNFKESPHVAHLKAHPNEYIGAVNKFVTFCLKKEEELESTRKSAVDEDCDGKK